MKRLIIDTKTGEQKVIEEEEEEVPEDEGESE